jgi:hypothetical protein
LERTERERKQNGRGRSTKKENIKIIHIEKKLNTRVQSGLIRLRNVTRGGLL